MKRNLFLLVLALQSAWILGTIGIQESRLRHSETVLLETRPVDPRDLIRGDFVILSYEISTIPGDRFNPPLTEPLADGTQVYVSLALDGTFHRVASAATERPDRRGGPVLKGTVRSRAGVFGAPDRSKVSVGIDYGLERYYVREGTGTPSGKLTVRVSVPASGQGVIKEVYVDGRPYTEAMKDVGR